MSTVEEESTVAIFTRGTVMAGVMKDDAKLHKYCNVGNINKIDVSGLQGKVDDAVLMIIHNLMITTHRTTSVTWTRQHFKTV